MSSNAKIIPFVALGWLDTIIIEDFVEQTIEKIYENVTS